METKGITCKIPQELHQQISREIQEKGMTVGKFIEQIIREHFAKEELQMSKGRTLQIKDYLIRYEQVFGKKLSQRQFVLGLIQQALEEADEDFEAARAGSYEADQEEQAE